MQPNLIMKQKRDRMDFAKKYKMDFLEPILDDTVVFGDATSHDKHLETVMGRIQESGLKLTKKKCGFRRTKSRFWG